MLSYRLATALLVAVLVMAGLATIITIIKLMPAKNVTKSASIVEDRSFGSREMPGGSMPGSLYNALPYALPLLWGLVVAAFIWRGRIRSVWTRQGYDYETFKLVARMRGSQVRVRLLNQLSLPKNKMQLAKELDVDWKTIDNHMELLLGSGLVQEMTQVGNAKYYIISEHGRKVLFLLEDSGSNVDKQRSSNNQ